jgi:hypothetical protein
MPRNPFCNSGTRRAQTAQNQAGMRVRNPDVSAQLTYADAAIDLDNLAHPTSDYKAQARVRQWVMSSSHVVTQCRFNVSL